MASTYSNLKFELIGTGDQSGTWGTTTNTNLGTAIEQALVGMATISSGFVTNSLTLTLTDTNAAQNARALVLNLTQALSGAGTLNVPAIQKPYMIINATGQTVTVKVTGLTGVAVPNGTRAFLYNNGTDVGDFFNYASSLTLGTDLAIADGGTGASTAPNARTNLGATTVGSNIFTLTNPSAITFLRINADNTVSALDAATFRTAIGAGTTSGAAGSNTQVQYNNAGAFAGSSNLTFDGTSLTLGGNPTLSAGTANGVLYLNGSKVATSGSALTFDGSAFWVAASSVSTDSLNVNGFRFGSGTFKQQFSAGFDFQQYYTAAGQSSPQASIFADTAAWGVKITGSEQMRLTSTGLGIGTSSPAVKLQVNDTSEVAIAISTGGTRRGAFYTDGSLTVINAYQGNPLIFSVASSGTSYSEKARIDSSGNLGLGVTPSAWRSTTRALQIGSTSSFQNFDNGGTIAVAMGNNYYWNSSDQAIYIQSKAASNYYQTGGQHVWQTAGSGTAGNAITFTQAMTLDASGNFYVGTTSQSGGSNITFNQPANADMKIAALVSTATRAAYQVFVNTTVTTVGTENSTGGSLASGTAAYATVLANGGAYPICFATNNTERVRITSGGNVGIGTSSPAQTLDVTGSSVTRGDVIISNGRQYNLQANATTGFSIYDASGGITPFQISTSGNVGIGLTPVANNGILQLNSYGAIKALIEGATVSATAATGTINYDAATQAVVYYTSNASANWTVNFRGSGSLSLNSMMQTGQSLTLAFLVTQGSTAYYNSAVQVDGSSVTPKWQGGTAPSAGNASSIDAYVYTIIKTGAATFTVLASQTKFA